MFPEKRREKNEIEREKKREREKERLVTLLLLSQCVINFNRLIFIIISHHNVAY